MIQPAEQFVNLCIDPAFEGTLGSHTPADATITFTTDTSWKWVGTRSGRFSGTVNSGFIISRTWLTEIQEGKRFGYRATINVITNTGALGVFVQYFNASGGNVGTRLLQAAPRHPASGHSWPFTGTGETDVRVIDALAVPAGAISASVGFFSQGVAGTYDFLVDAIMATHDLIDRNPTRPGEGWDVPPFGWGNMPDWEWLGTINGSKSRKRLVRVNWSNNPSAEISAAKQVGYQVHGAGDPIPDAPNLATRFLPSRTNTDSYHGSYSTQWTFTAPSNGMIRLFNGDPEDLTDTGMPVSNQDLTLCVGAIKMVTPPPPGALVYCLLETFTSAGWAYAKGYSQTPSGSWDIMSLQGMEEFPSEAGQNNVNVPNRPPKYVLFGFYIIGLTAGTEYTIRTDWSLLRADVLQTTPPDFDYFDGSTTNAEWIGTPGESPSRLHEGALLDPHRQLRMVV